MRRTYRIDGMHCAACEQTVRKALLLDPDVLSAEVSAQQGTATLEVLREVPMEKLRAAVARTGSYSLLDELSTTVEPAQVPSVPDDIGAPALATYYPLLLIGAFISGVALLAQWPLVSFNGMEWMRHFMAGFFLVFSFFKLLDVRAFADSYAMYDPIARRVRGWGVLYPFIELGLGLLYLTGEWPRTAAWATIVVMGVSAIGPVQSVLNKERIRCACLGAVFNLPMSTVTIVEDLLMVAMSIGMLIH